MTLEQIKTPCFIFKEDEFKENLNDFQKTLNRYLKKSKIGYSFKTNSLPYLLAEVLCGDGF